MANHRQLILCLVSFAVLTMQWPQAQVVDDEMAPKQTSTTTTTTTTTQDLAMQPQRTRELTPVDLRWGSLFDGQGRPTERLRNVYRGVGAFVMKDINPNASVITPAMMKVFYTRFDCRSQGDEELIPHLDIFGNVDPSMLQLMYQGLGCDYHLVPLQGMRTPIIPALTVTGFAQWMEQFALACPGSESRRLARVVEALPIDCCYTSAAPGEQSKTVTERLPKQLSRHLFPPRHNAAVKEDIADVYRDALVLNDDDPRHTPRRRPRIVMVDQDPPPPLRQLPPSPTRRSTYSVISEPLLPPRQALSPPCDDRVVRRRDGLEYEPARVYVKRSDDRDRESELDRDRRRMITPPHEAELERRLTRRWTSAPRDDEERRVTRRQTAPPVDVEEERRLDRRSSRKDPAPDRHHHHHHRHHRKQERSPSPPPEKRKRHRTFSDSLRSLDLLTGMSGMQSTVGWGTAGGSRTHRHSRDKEKESRVKERDHRGKVREYRGKQNEYYHHSRPKSKTFPASVVSIPARHVGVCEPGTDEEWLRENGYTV
ncbi:hypothetical protein GMORB2_7564 [Geosmithia morbida]|uniref:DUF7514 domain-containing protein n=1 Tax=Geosmithia morbida TaxID=1094350 RepID=A0A9P4YRV4_9HYPO|nr:uncharacterized protein GMORB2_7564 [Geosmithia morbida]KAF4121971.1 hypothetical protein GMORB2_7564 [Geosmithia morbida]